MDFNDNEKLRKKHLYIDIFGMVKNANNFTFSCQEYFDHDNISGQ